jgi:hypothetical protein
MSSSIRWRRGVTDRSVGKVAKERAPLVEETHRLPPSPPDQTSAQARHLTTSTMPRSGFAQWVSSALGPWAVDKLAE